MSDQDIRWKQRYKHFKQALSQLEKAVHLARQRPLSELEEQGLIQSFEYTHALAWNVLKDFLEEQGLKNLIASKDSSREAFKRGLIQDGETWMDMVQSRNLSSHTYNRNIAREIAEKIIKNYAPEFKQLIKTMELRLGGS